MYSPELLDHFEHPRNAGQIADPDASVQMENPICGDILKLTIKLSGARISEARFLAKGCVPAMAVGSVLTVLILDKTPAEAARLNAGDIVAIVGELPPFSTHACQLAMDALGATLRRLQDQHAVGYRRRASGQ